MARRMSLRLRLLIGVAALPLALFALLPLVSSGAPSVGEQDRAQAGPDRVAQGPRAGAVLRRRRLHAQDQLPAGRDHDAAEPARSGCRPASTAKRAELARDPGGPAPRAAAARPPARAARRGAHGARRAPGRALQGRQARRRDRRARVRRLRRPARAHRVHAARLAPGRADHRRSSRRAKADAIATEKRLDRLEARAKVIAEQIEDRGQPGRRGQGPARSSAGAATPTRARRRRRCWPPRATTARSSRATCASSRPSRRASPPRCSRAGAAAARSAGRPDPAPGSGGLIWPVNGPIVSPFGMRWGRLHAGVDIAVAGRARRSAPRSPAASCCSAGPAATATTPASSTAAGCPPATPTSLELRDLDGRERLARAR